MEISDRLQALAVLTQDIDLIGGWGGPQNRSGSGGEKKKPCPYQDPNPGRPRCSLVTILTGL